MMRKLYDAADLPDAYLLLHRLQQAGIAARVLNENAQGGMGEIPFVQAYPEVWLDDEGQGEEAERIVAAFNRRRAGDTPVRCRRCGEENPDTFELCWHCGRALDE